MLGGAYWATPYVLEPGFEHAVKLDDSTDLEFVDLKNDGIYEAVAWNLSFAKNASALRTLTLGS